MEADDDITDCLSQLGRTAPIPSDGTMALIEKLVCQLYLPKTEMKQDGGYFKRNNLSQNDFPQARQLYDRPS